MIDILEQRLCGFLPRVSEGHSTVGSQQPSAQHSDWHTRSRSEDLGMRFSGRCSDFEPRHIEPGSAAAATAEAFILQRRMATEAKQRASQPRVVHQSPAPGRSAVKPP